MILWCSKCGAYRKRRSSEWGECKYKSNHAMTPADEKITNEIDAIKARIAGAEDPSEDDLGKLGALEAIKTALVDDVYGDDSALDAMEMVIKDGLHAEGGGAFFWIEMDGRLDLVRDTSRELAAAVSIIHKKRYGTPARPHNMQDEVELRAAQLRLDDTRKAAAAGKRAVFDGTTLWVDLGGAERRIYGISAEGHGPAIPYGPGSRVILERHGIRMPTPAPKQGDWLGWLCDLIRIRPGQRETFSAHVCHMFCTHQETPAMVFEDGGEGPCGKTAAAGLVREVVDPVGFGRSVMVAPSRARDIIEAVKAPVLALDGADAIPREAARYLEAARQGLVLPDGRRPGYARLIMAGAGRRPPAGSAIYGLPPVERAEAPAALHAKLEGAKPHLLYEMFGIIRGALGLAAGPGGVASGFDAMLAAVSARRRPPQAIKGGRRRSGAAPGTRPVSPPHP